MLLVVLFFTFRNTILRKVINSKIQSVENKYNLNINYSDVGFSGLSTVNISRISVVPVNRDTLASVEAISVKIKPFDLLLNRLRFANLTVTRSLISLKRTGTISNYMFLLDQKKDTSVSIGPSEKDYGSRISVLVNAIFNHVPSTTVINEFKITASIDSNSFSFYFPRLQVSNRYFSTTARVTDDHASQNWKIAGLLDSYEKKLMLSIKSTDTHKVIIPYIRKRWNTSCAFDSAGMQMSFNRDHGVTRMTGKALLSGPLFNNPRVSPDDVEMKKGEISYTLNVGKNYLEVDSSTYISFNEVGFHPYVMYTMQPSKVLTFKIHEPQFSAQSFFNSLPAGLFHNLQEIKVHGDLSFNLDFHIDFDKPDLLTFNAKLRGKGFGIDRFGNTNFTYINEPFLYTAYENGQPVRQFIVGEENPNYRTLDEIPHYLKEAVMTSEDGQFYYHNGFIPDAIRYSLITNIKKKRFARGGSTISMQLVKNVFLTRNKNITRKLEEMLITWLIESKQMVTKDRMLEVYLNIIETGPLTYGVNEAAQFYFQKDVSKLTLAESIYIASIVPRPKNFKYSFDKEGNLREYLANYYTLVSGKMLRKGWITQEEYDNLKPEITLKGPARGFIVTDTVPNEEELIIEKPGIFDFLNFNFLKKKKDTDNKEADK